MKRRHAYWLLLLVFFVLSVAQPVEANDVPSTATSVPAEGVDAPEAVTEDEKEGTPWALPAYVYVLSTGQTDVGVFTILLEYDSKLLKGHKYRVGAFAGAELLGPGVTVSLFDGTFRGDPAEFSVGAFWLSDHADLFDESQLSVGFTVRVLF
jgi:hypothetical protein